MIAAPRSLTPLATLLAFSLGTLGHAAPSATLAPLSDDVFAQLAAIDGDKPQVALGTVEDNLRAQSPEERARQEPKLLALLEAPTTSIFAKQAITRILAWTGSAKAVPVLEKQAANDELSNYVTRALAGIDDASAEAALIRLAASGPVGARTSAINALGQRRATSAAAIAELKRSASVAAPETAKAALEALALINTPEAFDVLRDLPREGASAGIRTQALLNASARAVRLSNATPAASTAAATAARDVLATSKVTPLRIEAARILLLAGGAKATPQLLPLTRDADPLVRQAVARSLVLSGDPETLKSVLGGFATLETDTKLAILHIAYASGSPTLLPFAQAALAAKDAETRQLAILSAGRTGNETTLDTLLPLLNESGDIAGFAKLAIGYLPTGKVDAVLRSKLAAATIPAAKATLLSIIADRQDREVFAQAVALTQDGDNTLRGAAFDATAKLVRPGDLPAILPLSANIKSSSDRRDWQKAVFSTAGNHPNPAQAAKLIQEAIAKPDAAERPIFIGALTVIAGDESAQALRNLLTLPDTTARKEVIRALSAARTEGSFALLLDTAQKTTDPTERILALRGYLDTIDSRHLNEEKRVGAYRAAWPLASRQEEKDAIIAAVKRINNNSKSVKKLLEEIAPGETKSDTKA